MRGHPDTEHNPVNNPKTARYSYFFLAALIFIFSFLAPFKSLASGLAEDYFNANCISCHTIGQGALVGPDLSGVTERRDRDWLIAFMQNPGAMIDRGDPVAVQLKDAANGIVMPTFPDIDREMAELLIVFLESKSGSSTSPGDSPAPVEVQQNEAFTHDEIAAGEKYFTGTSHLKNNGPACISCHTTSMITGLGGGRLGPDLTMVVERLGGVRSISAWLSAPATATMRPLFTSHPLTDEEIRSIVAYLDDASKSAGSTGTPGTRPFVTLGISGTLIIFIIFGLIWRSRFRSVRSELVKSATSGGY
ncbi:MAG TPA: c-type cytochrome [bacterium]|jgi:cytochrome c2